jgi:hypothetical protein
MATHSNKTLSSYKESFETTSRNRTEDKTTVYGTTFGWRWETSHCQTKKEDQLVELLFDCGLSMRIPEMTLPQFWCNLVGEYPALDLRVALSTITPDFKLKNTPAFPLVGHAREHAHTHTINKQFNELLSHDRRKKR